MDFMTNLPEAVARARAGANLTEVERLTLIMEQASRITKCEEVIASISKNKADMMTLLIETRRRLDTLEEKFKSAYEPLR